MARRLPARLQRAIRIGIRPTAAIARHRILRSLSAEPIDVPDPTTMDRLREAWGGGGVGTTELELEICRRAQEARRPILECGSGLSTLLLGIYAQVPVWSLEESDYWYRRVRAALTWYGIEGVRLVHAPLVSHGDLRWYRIPDDLPEEFDLIVCDGPEAHQREGLPRYGLVPVLSHAIDTDTALVVDDVERESERRTIARWEDWGLTVERIEGSDRRFAIVARRTGGAPSSG